MRDVTTSLTERAKSIFTDLGYTVSRRDTELFAEHKWRLVNLTISEPERIPMTGEFRCFVTPTESAASTHHRVSEANPNYEWAVIAIDDDGEYEVFDEPIPA